MTFNPKVKTRVLWSFLFAGILATILIVLGWRSDSLWVMIFLYLLPALTLLLHAAWTLGWVRGLALFGLGGATGWFFEVIGLKYGTFFGGDYVYGMNMLSIIGVPVAVIIYWASFIYLGYATSNSFLVWLKQQKPNKSIGTPLNYMSLVLLDGLTVTALDLFMDPIMVHQKAWIWLQGGPYFGVPIGNFIGWFTITILVTGVFRLWEYLVPVQSPKISKSVFLIPVLSYAGGAIAFFYAAWQLEMWSFIGIGGLLMTAIVICNLWVYRFSLKGVKLELTND